MGVSHPPVSRRSVGNTSKQPYFHLSACRRSSRAGIQSAIQGEWVFTRRIEDCAKPSPRSFASGPFIGAGREGMPDAAGPEIVIAGTREDWPGGAQTLTPRDPTREPNGRLWFGAEPTRTGASVVPDHGGGRRPVSPHRPPPAWLMPDRQLQPELNRFEVRVSNAGDDTWIERLRW